MKHLYAIILILILSLYPFLSFVARDLFSVNINYLFGAICMALLAQKVYHIYFSGKNLRIPYYLFFFGCFTCYVILIDIFLSGTFMQLGAIKYFYSSPLLIGFIAFLLIENTHFPAEWIKFSTKIISVILVIGAIVSIIQISDPLFFLDPYSLKQGLSFEQLKRYYVQHPEEYTNYISRLMAGYRFSIYSWIDSASVGFDSLAIFSLLLADPSIGRVKKGVITGAAGIISFLSSARWIMLNFLIIAAQNFFLQKNKFLNGLKYLFLGIALLFTLGVIANFMGVDVNRFVEERLFAKSAGTRLYAFEVFFKLFPESPIFGSGGEENEELAMLIRGRTTQIHVGYLNLFYRYGLVGGIIFLTFLASFLFRFWTRAKQSNYWGSFFAVLAFAIANLTLVSLHLLFHGFLLALIFSNYYFLESLNPAKDLMPGKTDNYAYANKDVQQLSSDKM